MEKNDGCSRLHGLDARLNLAWFSWLILSTFCAYLCLYFYRNQQKIVWNPFFFLFSIFLQYLDSMANFGEDSVSGVGSVGIFSDKLMEEIKALVHRHPDKLYVGQDHFNFFVLVISLNFQFSLFINEADGGDWKSK